MGIFRCNKCGHTFSSRGDDSKPKRCNQCWSNRVLPIEDSIEQTNSDIISAQVDLDSMVQEIYRRLLGGEKVNDIILELEIPPRLVVLVAQDFLTANKLQQELNQTEIEMEGMVLKLVIEE